MRQETQQSLYCRCGPGEDPGQRSVRYLLHPPRQDRRHFGGLREQVLELDGYCCRGCGAPGRDKRSIVVHHRRPGRSKLDWMISLCPACHAKIHRTQAVLSEMPPLLLALWRELHPKGHEQGRLEFDRLLPPPEPVRLFEDLAGK